MLDKTLIGRESESLVVEVERGAIRRLADAVGDQNPFHSDEAAARAAGFASLLAPPTFPAVLSLNERFRHSLDLGTRSLLRRSPHGEEPGDRRAGARRDQRGQRRPHPRDRGARRRGRVRLPDA